MSNWWQCQYRWYDTSLKYLSLLSKSSYFVVKLAHTFHRLYLQSIYSWRCVLDCSTPIGRSAARKIVRGLRWPPFELVRYATTGSAKFASECTCYCVCIKVKNVGSGNRSIFNILLCHRHLRNGFIRPPYCYCRLLSVRFPETPSSDDVRFRNPFLILIICEAWACDTCAPLPVIVVIATETANICCLSDKWVFLWCCCCCRRGESLCE